MSSLRRAGVSFAKKSRSTKRGSQASRRHDIRVMEELEQRLAPATHLLAGLEFFTPDPTFTPTSKVQIGKDPGAGTFIPLMEVASGFSYDDAASKFTTSGTVSAIIGPTPIPLFNGTRTFAVPDFLTNIGAAVSNGLSMAAAKVSFGLTNVEITSNALKLQGAITLPGVSNFTVAVKGNDYVVIDTSGIRLTGLNASIPNGTSFGVGGLNFTTQNVNVAYTSQNDVFALTGTAAFSLSTGAGKTINAGVTLGDATLGTKGLVVTNGALSGFDMAVTASVALGTTTIATNPTGGLKVTYDTASSTFTMSGGATASFGTGRSLAMTFGGTAADNTPTPGLVIQNGAFKSLDASANITAQIAGNTFAGNGVRVSYVAASDTLAVSGAASFTTANNQTLTFSSFSVVVAGGQLSSLSGTATVGGSLAGASITASNISASYAAATASAPEQITGSGSLTVKSKTNQTLAVTVTSLVVRGGVLSSVTGSAKATGTVGGATLVADVSAFSYQSAADKITATASGSITTSGSGPKLDFTALDLVITGGNLTSLTGSANASGSVAGATLAATVSAFSYTSADDTLSFTASGSITTTNSGPSLSFTGVSIVIVSGKLSSLAGTMSASGKIAGASFSATNLSVTYAAAQVSPASPDKLTVTGTATLSFGTNRTITVGLGSVLPDSSTSAGIVISGGVLQQLDALGTTTTAITVAGVSLTTTGVRVVYQAASGSTPDRLAVTGNATVAFGTGRSFTLGLGSKLLDNTTTAGLIISGGALQQLDALATTAGISVAGVTISTTGLRLVYQAAAGSTPEQLAVTGNATVAFGTGRSFTLGLGSKLPDNTTTAGLLISGGALQQVDALATTAGIGMAGVTLATTGLRMMYVAAAGATPEQLAVTGNATVAFGAGRSFTLGLGSKLPDNTTTAGLLISGGVLQQVDALATTTGISVAGVTVTTTGLRLVYQAASGQTPEQLAVTGNATVSFGAGRTFTLGLGSKLADGTTTSAGLLISNGALQQLDALATTTGISVAGVTVSTTGLRLVYQAASGQTPEQLAVTGNATVSFGAGRTFTLGLGSKLPDNTTSAGLLISGGSLQKLDAFATTTGITVAGVTLSTTGLRLAYQAAAGSTPEQLAVTGNATLAFGTGRTFTLGLGSKLADGTTTSAGLLISNGALQQLDALATMSPSITIAGATITSTKGLHVLYQASTDTVAVTGDASIAFGSGRVFTLGLGSKLADGSTSVGLLIAKGSLQQLDAQATMSPGITIAGATLTSTNGLHVLYNAATASLPEQLAVTGDAKLDFGSSRVITLGLGSKLADGTFSTGLLIRDGALAALDATGSITNIKIAAATFNATNLRVIYQANPELLAVSGNATLDFGSGRRLELGLGTPSNDGLSSAGLIIRNGVLSTLDATGSLTGLAIAGGSLNATNLHVVYQANPELISVTGNAALTLASNSLNLVISTFTIQSGSLKALNASVTSNITVAGLKITTKALKVNYQAADTTITPAIPETMDITGTASIIVKQQSIALTLGQAGKNGLFIQNNAVQSLDATVTSNISVSSLQFKTNSLRLTYQKGVPASGSTPAVPEQFTIKGGASFQVQSNTVQVQFGDAALKTQGLVIKDGALASLDMAVTGTLTVGALAFDAKNLRVTYSTSDDPALDGLFTISGSSSVAVKDKFKLDVDFGDPTLKTKGLVIQNGDLKSLDIAVKSTATFTIAGLSISPDSLRITYDADLQTFTAGGAAHFSLKGSRIDVALGVPGKSQGLVIRNGDLQLLQMSVSTDKPIKLMGLSIGAKNLTVAYVAASATTPSMFGMYGSLTVSSGEAGTKTFNSLTALMGNAAKPGILISGGTLQQLNIGLSGSFNLYGLSIAPQSLYVRYSTVNNVDTLIVSGGVSVALADTIKVDVAFPDNGLSINTTTGEVSVKNLSFMTSVNIGILKVRDLYFSYTTDAVTNAVSISAGFRKFDIENDNAGITLPGGILLAGSFTFRNGTISAVAVAVAGARVPIGSTGFFITAASGSIDHLDDPSNLVVDASLTINFGTSVRFAGTNYSLLEATGSIQVSTSNFKLHGSVKLLEGVLGSGSVDLDLNWSTGIYSAHVNVSMYAGVFVVDGSFTFTSTGDVTILATAKVRIPDVVPFIGGTTLAGMGFYLQIRPNEDMSHSFAAGWISIDLFFFSATVGVKYDFDNHISIINGDDVGSFAKPAVRTPASYTYTSPEFTLNDPSKVASMGVEIQSDSFNPNTLGTGARDAVYVLEYNDKAVLSDPNAYKDPTKLRVLTYKDFLWLQANGTPTPKNDNQPQTPSALPAAVPNDVTVPDVNHKNQRVLSISPIGKNVAMLGKATQSSDAYGAIASRAIDGKSNGDWNAASVSHTENRSGSWWADTLTQGYFLSQISLYNRTDAVQKRLSNFTVTVYNNSVVTFSQSYFTQAGTYAPPILAIPLPSGTWGNKVEVKLNGNNNNGDGILSLAEVEIYTEPENRYSLDFKHYQVVLESTKSLDSAPPTFSNTVNYRTALVGLDSSMGASNGYQVDLTIGNSSRIFAPPNGNSRVSYFVDTDNSGYDGTLIGTRTIDSTNVNTLAGSHFIWNDFRSLAPNPYTAQNYYFYAVVDDGSNPPVPTNYTSFRLTPENPYPTITTRSGQIPTTASVLPITVSPQLTGDPQLTGTRVVLSAKYGTWLPQPSVAGVTVSPDRKTVTLTGTNISTLIQTQKYQPPTGDFPGYDLIDVNAANLFSAGSVKEFSVTDQLTVYPKDNADLVVTQQVDNSLPAAGAPLNFTFKVTNRNVRNTGAATNVTLTEVLPSGVSFVSATPSVGSYDPDTGVWSIGSLAVGQSVTLAVRAVVDANASGLNLISTAKASADQVLIAPSDATSNAIIGVTGPVFVTTATDITDTSTWLSTRRARLNQMLQDQSVNYPREIAFYNSQIPGVKAQLDPASSLNTRINALKNRISTNQTALAQPGLTDAQKTVLNTAILTDQNELSPLQRQYANYQDSLNRLTTARDAVQAKLDALPTSISSLQVQISSTPVGLREAVVQANASPGDTEIHIAKNITDLNVTGLDPILVTTPIIFKADAPTPTTIHVNNGSSFVATSQNIYLNAVATQSSDLDPAHKADKVIDGNTDGRYDLGSVASTANRTNSYWQVQLASPYVLSGLQLFGGTDYGDPKRLSNFHVSVFNGSVEVYRKDFFTTPNTFAPLPWPFTIDLPKGTVGDRVMVQLNGLNNIGDGSLVLAEVKLFTPAPSATFDNLSLDLSTNNAFVVQNGSSVSFTNDSIFVTGRGGTMFSNYGNMSFTNTVISHSQFGDNTGSKLIQSSGTLNFKSSSIQFLSTQIVSNAGTLNITNSTFANDSALLDPTLPMIANSGQANILDSTFGAYSSYLNNRPGFGGSVLSNQGGRLTITNSSFDYNYSTNPILDNSTGTGTVDLQGTVIGASSFTLPGGGVLNRSASVVKGPFRSLGRNLVSTTDGSTGWGSTDLTGTLAKPLAPGLATLANNGGPTPTMIPTPGSKLLDAGFSTTQETTDQTGNPRVVNGLSDIGAVEVPFGTKSSVKFSNVPTQASANAAIKFTVSIFDSYGRPARDGVVTLTYYDEFFKVLSTAQVQFTPADGGVKTVTYQVTGIPYPLRIVSDTNEQATISNFMGLFVNSLVDTVPGQAPSGGLLSLRQAVELSNTVPGTKYLALDNGVYNLTNGPLTIGQNVSFLGRYGQTNQSAATVVNGNGRQIFVINEGAQVSMDHLELKGGSGAVGGAIANQGNLTITSSTLDGNTASVAGGAIWNMGILTVSQSTLANNKANGPLANGGAIWNGGTLSLNAVTISANTAGGSGGGVHSDQAKYFTAINTLIAGNSAVLSGVDVLTNALADQGNNLFGVSAGIASPLQPTDVRDQLPKLGPLQNNGGFLPTMVPAVGSPAVDAGTVGSSDLYDERGGARIVAGATDIGAVEVQLDGPLTRIVYSGVPSVVAVGATFNIGVQGLDDYGHPADGTVRFRSSDPNSLNPTSLTFSKSNTFPLTVPVTFATAGSQILIASNTIAGVTVSTVSDPIQVYSTIQVTTLSDVVDPSDGVTSLREAVSQATASPTLLSIAFAVTGNVVLASPLSIPSGAKLRMEGAGASISVQGRTNRAFLIANGASVTMTNVTIKGDNLANAVLTLGGGIENRGSLTLVNSSLGNLNFNGGGAALVNYGTLVADSSRFETNKSVGSGGAVDLKAGSATFRNGTIFSDNQATTGDGGAIIAASGTLNIAGGATFSGNRAVEGGGGAISIRNTVVNVDSATFSGNKANLNGGAIQVENSIGGASTVNFTNDVFSGNTAQLGNGGSVFNDVGNVVNVTNSTFNSSSAKSGGAVANRGTTKIAKSTFNGNFTTSLDGGAIYHSQGTMTVGESTFTANLSNGYGGAIYNLAELKLFSDTIVGNRSGLGGGGLYRLGGTTTVGTSIIAKNTVNYNVGPDVVGSVVSTGYNLVGILTVESSGWLASGTGKDLTGTTFAPIDPLLKPLADNGGPTLTMYPNVGSPIIDAGPATSPDSTDQRGLPRINGPATDIGAVEDPPGLTGPTLTVPGNPINWTGSVDTDWANPGNWDTGVVPGPDDNVTIDADGATITYPSGASTINSLVSNASIELLGGSLTLRNGGTATSGVLMIDAGATLTFGGGAFVVDPNAAGIGGAGRLIVTGSATLDDQSDYAVQGGTEIQDGRLVLSGRTSSSFKVEDAGILEFATDASLIDQVGSIVGNGFVEVDAGSVVTVTGTYNLSGVTDVMGSLILKGGDGGTSTGDFHLATGGTLKFAAGDYSLDRSSSLTGSGDVTVDGANLSIAGVDSLDGETSLLAGTVSFASGSPVTLGALTLAGGVLAGTDNLVVLGPMSWTGGTFGGSGTIAVRGGMNLGGDGATLNLDGRTLSNESEANFAGLNAVLLMSNGAVINNTASGTWDMKDAMDIALGSSTTGAERFENAGAFLSEAVVGSAHVDVPFLNSGSVEIKDGELSLNDGDAGTTRGSITIAEMGMLTFGGGDFTLDSAASLGGPGMMQIEGSNVTVNGSYSVGGCAEIMNGTLTFNHGFSGASSFQVDAGSAMTFNPGTYSLDAGSLVESAGNLVINGASLTTAGRFESTSGVRIDAGVLTLQGVSGGTFAIAQGALVNLSGPNLSLLPSTSFTGAGDLHSSGAAGVVLGLYSVTGNTEVISGSLALAGGDGGVAGHFVVDPNAVLRVDTDPFAPATLNVLGGTLLVTNEALVEPADMLVSNSGMVDLQQGVLSLHRVTGGGTYVVDQTSSLIFLNDATLDASSSIVGLGRVVVDGARVVEPGMYSVSGSTTIIDGALILGGGDGGTSGTFDVEDGGTLSFTGGQYSVAPGSYVTGTGNLSLSGGGRVEVKGAIRFSGPIDIQAGTLTLAGGNQGGQIGGRIALPADGTLVFASGAYNLMSDGLTGNGRVVVDGGSLVQVNGVYRVGSTDIRDGVLTLMYGDGGSSGPILIEGRGTLDLRYGSFDTSSNGLTGSGSVVVNGASVVFGSADEVGSLTLLGGKADFSGGTMSFQTLNLFGGELTGTSRIEVAGIATWTGGAIRGDGVVDILGQLIVEQKVGSPTLDGRELIVEGSAAMDGDGTQLTLIGGASIENRAGATWTFRNSDSVLPGQTADGTEVFRNAGTVVREGSGDLATIGTRFINTNLVDVRARSLSFEGDLDTTSGVIQTEAEGKTEVVAGLRLGTSGGFRGEGTADVLTPIVSNSDANTSYVIALYQDLLRRAPDGVGLTFWHVYLTRSGDRAGVVSGIAGSKEYRRLATTELYAQYLHRLPTAAELERTSELLVQQSRDVVAASLAGSAEYYVNMGRGSNAGFLASLYLDVFGRAIDTQTASAALARLANGTRRIKIIQEVLASDEHRALVANGLYRQFLHRDADPAGLQNAVVFLQAGREESLATHLVASAEYSAGFATYTRHANAPFLAGIVDELLHGADRELVFAFEHLLDQGRSRVAVALELMNSIEFRTLLVDSFAKLFLGRPAAPEALAGFVKELTAGATDEQVAAEILGSSRFFDLAGRSNDRFVQMLFDSVLRRETTKSERAFWVSALARGVTRQTVAYSFLTSREAISVLVSRLIDPYQPNPIDPNTLAAYVELLKNRKVTDEVILAFIATRTPIPADLVAAAASPKQGGAPTVSIRSAAPKPAAASTGAHPVGPGLRSVPRLSRSRG